ncbi:hypothetical protein [Oceanobacillus sp. Castelsardo]|uniref:hypothetical protein n=1 Tax=Oceanobacillus sp. Castelsardo TaxID=1851204 RepID=UPI000838C5C4|nr:hypothetical protein [Oceanobacillus sp. Castelsardo]
MQKNYRDYTVGELLDMGLKMEIYNHNSPSEKEAYQLLKRFEGIKRSYYTIDRDDDDALAVVKGWKGEFAIKNFLKAKK